MRIDILGICNATPHETMEIGEAVQLIHEAVGSSRFAELLMAADVTEDNGHSNSEIVQELDKAAVKITVVMYYNWWTKVVGYTYFKTNKIYVNRKYFGSKIGVASNLLHEISHILGYGHARIWRTSLPYTLNRILEQVALELRLLSRVS